MLLAHAQQMSITTWATISPVQIPAMLSTIYPYTGGSRFIQAGLLSRAQMTRSHSVWLLSRCCWRVARGVARSGCDLARVRGTWARPPVFAAGVQLSARGLGEATVAIGFGALPVLVPCGYRRGSLINRGTPVPAGERLGGGDSDHQRSADIEADRRAHKRTLVVRWGVGGAGDLSRACVTPGGLGAIIGVTRCRSGTRSPQ